MVVRASTVLGGRYRLGDRIGRGGMAEVFDAVDERLARPVAVKVLRPEMAARPDVRRRFEAEARAAARLSHPNVVAVFDTGEDDGVPWLVMERLPGETVADRITATANGAVIEVDWVRRLAGDVLGALGAAHDAGIVHRDVKPGNILIGADGCAKVADFGIAKSLDPGHGPADEDATDPGQLVGTPAYLAPERVEGHPATVTSDLYAVGVVLADLLRVAHGDAPVAMTDAIERAMRRDPAERFASAAEMASALRSGLSGADDVTVVGAPALADATIVLDRQPPPPVPQAVPVEALVPGAPSRRSPYAIAGVAAVAAGLLLLLAGAFALTRAGGDDRPELASDLEAAAGAMAARDGPRHGEAAGGLRNLATAVDRDDPAAGDAANALLTSLANWRASGGLTATAAERASRVVLRVPGADRAAYAPTVTTPPPPPAPEGRGDDGGDDDGKRGKKGKGDD